MDDLEDGRKLFAGPCDFMLGVAGLEQLPISDLPEVAFAGRSNVGKSSLINALTGRKTLARISNTPGRTQQLNFFDLGGRLHLVDLPGYGYAEAPKAKVEAWTHLVMDYLNGRAKLRRAFVLIDARHGLKPIDHEVMDILDTAAVSYQIILTKGDKLKEPGRKRIVDATTAGIKRHVAAYPEVLMTSSVKSLGVPELRAEITALAAPPPAPISGTS